MQPFEVKQAKSHQLYELLQLDGIDTLQFFHVHHQLLAAFHRTGCACVWLFCIFIAIAEYLTCFWLTEGSSTLPVDRNC